VNIWTASSSNYLGGILNQHKKSGVDKPGRFILSERKDLCDDLAIEGTILSHSDTCPRELNFVHKSKVILGLNMPAMDCIVVSKCECSKLHHQIFLCMKSRPFFWNSQSLNSIAGLKSIPLKHREGSCMIFLVEKISGTGSLYLSWWNDSCICVNLLCKYEMMLAFEST
jgi:hypothetical protein